MNEPIKVGDLVMVVRECCPVDSVLGLPFTVLRLARGSECSDCGSSDNFPSAVLEEETEEFHAFALPLSYLKKIPPFPELADERHDEEITA